MRSPRVEIKRIAFSAHGFYDFTNPGHAFDPRAQTMHPDTCVPLRVRSVSRNALDNGCLGKNSSRRRHEQREDCVLVLRKLDRFSMISETAPCKIQSESIEFIRRSPDRIL